MDFLYSLLVTVAVALVTPWYLVRYGFGRWPSGYWRERMGLVPKGAARGSGEEGGRPPTAIWIHAVSVGETLAMVNLVAELRERFPGRALYLSHVTPAGSLIGAQQIGGVAGRFYLPIDWKWAMRRAFDRLRPAMLILAETEVWPNLLAVARERGTPVILVNARLSERSVRGYRRFGFFFGRVFANISHVFAQTLRDAARFRELGVPGERITVAGNMKSDLKLPRAGALAGQLRRGLEESGRKAAPVLVAGSTVPGEERVVLNAWDVIRGRCPQAFLVIAPRRPERFDEVARLLAGEGRRFVRRTALDAATTGHQLDGADILLLDTIGELAGVYELADVAFVGGSLAGPGHNPLEPAFWAKPVLFGPNMFAFEDVAERFVAAGGAFKVKDSEELAGRTVELFTDPRLRETVGAKAEAVLESSAGPTLRVAEGLGRWLHQDATPVAAERAR